MCCASFDCQPGIRIALCKLLQVFLNPFHRGHPEGHFLVHGAELAPVVGASLSDLQKRPVGISVYGYGKIIALLATVRYAA